MQKMTCMTYKSINGIHASYETYALICLNMKNMHEIWINIPAGLLDRLQGDIARVLIRPATFNTCQPIAGPPKCVLKRGGIRHVVIIACANGSHLPVPSPPQAPSRMPPVSRIKNAELDVHKDYEGRHPLCFYATGLQEGGQHDGHTCFNMRDILWARRTQSEVSSSSTSSSMLSECTTCKQDAGIVSSCFNKQFGRMR